MTGKIRADRKQSGRMMGVGLGKGLKLGFELGTPVEKQHCMSNSQIFGLHCSLEESTLITEIQSQSAGFVMSELTDFWKSCAVWWAQISSLKPYLDGSSFLNYIWVSILITWRLRCKQNSMRHAIRASTVVHIGQKTQGNALWKHFFCIRMGLVFSKDCWVFRKTIGHLLWNYTEDHVRKTQTWQIQTGLKS